jgi:tetratricopeptide (TPR) repeat protein
MGHRIVSDTMLDKPDSLLDSLDTFRRRSLMIGGLVLLAIVVWGVSTGYVGAPAGDYETRQGNILLTDRKFDQALDRFDAALAAHPQHRGAMMGRAIALLQQDRQQAAEKAFDDLIAILQKTMSSDDPAGPGALAVAYADRGILYDRGGQPEKALADYRRALAVNAEAVAGPGLLDRVLYGTPDPATVAKRIAYLEGQLHLPPAERVLNRPEIDARQRMYKP